MVQPSATSSLLLTSCRALSCVLTSRLRAGSGRVLGSPELGWGLGPGQQLLPISRELTPLEEASLQNQKLKAAYEARVARLDASQALQKTSLVSRSQGGLCWRGRGQA